MLSNEPGKKLNKYVSDYVIYDLETTRKTVIERKLGGKNKNG